MLQAARRAVAVVSALLGLSACNTEIVLTEDRHPGHVEIRPVDSAGECVKGVLIDFTLPDGSISRGMNAYHCQFIAAGPPGEWIVAITPPQGYALGPDQERTVRITVAKRETTLVAARLVRTGP